MEPKKIIDDTLSHTVEQNADALYEFGQQTENSGSLSDEDTAKTILFVMLGHLAGVIAGFAIFALSPLEIWGSMGLGLLIPMGIYSTLTGRAILKPDVTKHALFSGWKGRVIGIMYVALGVYFLVGSVR